MFMLHPPILLNIGEEDEAMYSEAMTKGCIQSALALLIFVGVTGSGKSLFKRLVLGLSVPEFSPSTALAESAVCSMSICQVAVDGGGVKMKWIPVEPKNMMDMVAKAIKDGVPLIESNWGESSELPVHYLTE